MGVTPEPPWTNFASGTAPRNGSTSHTINFGFTSTTGRFLVVEVFGAVTNAAAGWTEQLAPVASAELSVFTKTSAGESSITVTHNGSNYPVHWTVREYAAGSTWVGYVDSNSNVDTFPALTGLPGVEVVVHAVRGRSASNGLETNATAVWTAPFVEDADLFSALTGGTDGAGHFTSAHAINITATSITPSATTTYSGTWSTPDREKAVYAINAVAPASTTSVSSDLDTRWRVRAQVSQSLDSRWRVRQSVSQSLDSRWRVYNTTSQSLDSRWRVRNSISQSLDSRWRVRSLTSQDLDSRWRVREIISQSLDSRWRVRALATQSLDSRWRVYNLAQQSLDTRWRVRNLVSSDLDTRWAVDASVLSVSSDLDSRWRVRNSVVANLDTRWRVRQSVISDLDTRWAVDSSVLSVSSDLDARWRVRGPVAADLDSRWRVRARVSSDLDARWRVYVSVDKDLDLRWRIRELVSQVLDTRWITYGRVYRDLSIRWRTEGETYVYTNPPFRAKRGSVTASASRGDRPTFRVNRS